MLSSDGVKFYALNDKANRAKLVKTFVNSLYNVEHTPHYAKLMPKNQG